MIKTRKQGLKNEIEVTEEEEECGLYMNLKRAQMNQGNGSHSKMQIPGQVSAVPLPPPSCLVYRGDTSAVTMMEKILANWQYTNQGIGRGKPILYTF